MTSQVSQNTSYHPNFCVFDIKIFGIFSKILAFFLKNWLFSQKSRKFYIPKKVFLGRNSWFLTLCDLWIIHQETKKSEDRHFLTLRRYLQVKQLFWWNKKSEDRYFLTLQRYLQVKQLTVSFHFMSFRLLASWIPGKCFGHPSCIGHKFYSLLSDEIAKLS